jgi:protein-S-isoprenylcysteine O-methyltransferase Ste14
MHESPRKPWVKAYLLSSAALWLGGFALIVRRSPGLIAERVRPGPGAVEGLGEETLLYALPAAGHWALAAIDRPGSPWWRPMPKALHLLGLVGYLAANLVVIWAELSNPFFSSAVRIQAERGQHVVSTGPYAFVRHPGYAGGMAFFPMSGLALGSWLSLIPALVFSVLIVRRARMEDAFLQRRLAGYPEYAKRVRFRLVPGIW